MPSVPPTGATPPRPPEPDQTGSGNTPAPPATSGGGGAEGMTAFMKLFTPEQKKKFMNILIQNLVGEIKKTSKKYIDELRKQKEDIEKGS